MEQRRQTHTVIFRLGYASGYHSARVLSIHGACQRHMGYSRLNVLLNRNHHLFTNKKTIIMTQSMSLKLICSCIVAAVFVIGAASCATSKYQQALDKQLQQNGTSNSNQSPTNESPTSN
jgi:hypothetical protein